MARAAWLGVFVFAALNACTCGAPAHVDAGPAEGEGEGAPGEGEGAAGEGEGEGAAGEGEGAAGEGEGEGEGAAGEGEGEGASGEGEGAAGEGEGAAGEGEGEGPLPPDPSTIAPALSAGSTSGAFELGAFLLGPIQTGVAAGTIDPVRAALVRGRVLDGDGVPLPGATVSVAAHSELGQTISRADGFYDLLVNGGGPLRINAHRAGHIDSERVVDVKFGDWGVVDDLWLTALDPVVTDVTLDGIAGPQVATSTIQTDADGTRSATMFFPRGALASLAFSDGSTAPIDELHVRATELTVGVNGPARMPAPLPPTSAYTYCIEVTVDEALAAGAPSVTFSKNVAIYVDNFIGYPAGSTVPLGFFDRARGVWVAAPDSVVIGVVGATAGLADLDLDGDGSADPPATFGIDDDERAAIAGRFSAGDTFWRASVPHFSLMDLNAVVRSADNTPPPPPAQTSDGSSPDGTDCTALGSHLGCIDQTVGETIAAAGTGLALDYESDRVDQRPVTLTIPVTGPVLPLGIDEVGYVLTIAGRTFRNTFTPAAPNITATVVWDRKDAFGRFVAGTVIATVETSVSAALTTEVAHNLLQLEQLSTFGQRPGESGQPTISFDSQRNVGTATRTTTFPVGGIDVRGVGLGGFDLSVHHIFDPAAGVLYFGDGRRREASSVAGVNVQRVYAGLLDVDGGDTPLVDGADAITATFPNFYGFAIAPDGTMFITEEGANCVQTITPDGIAHTLVGDQDHYGYSGDEGPAIDAFIGSPDGAVLAPDGTLFFQEFDNCVIRSITPDGIIHTVAGTGICEEFATATPDNVVAAGAPLAFDSYGLGLGADGSLFFVDGPRHSSGHSTRVRRISPNGIVTTIAGNLTLPQRSTIVPPTEGALATTQALSLARAPLPLPDGGVAFSDGDFILEVTVDGLMHRLGGNGVNNSCAGVGGPALDAALNVPAELARGPDGSLYFNNSCAAISRITPDGRLETVMTQRGPDSLVDTTFPTVKQHRDFVLAARAGWSSSPEQLAFGPDGFLYVPSAYAEPGVFRIVPLFPKIAAGNIVIPSEDATELYEFTSDGRHLNTRDARFGGLKWSFEYDAAERLTAVVDGDGRRITIERDGAGDATAIVAPSGERTTLVIGADGLLASAADDAGDVWQMTYGAGASGGLMSDFTDPRGGTTSFTYDPSGRVIAETDPNNATTTFARTFTANADGSSDTFVTHTTRTGLTQTFDLAQSAGGSFVTTFVDTTGAVSTTTVQPDGNTIVNLENGLRESVDSAADPRFGSLAPVQSTIATLPSGQTTNVNRKRSATFGSATELFGVSTLSETVDVGGRVTTTALDVAARAWTFTSPVGRVTTAHADDQGRTLDVSIAGLDEEVRTFVAGDLVAVARGAEHVGYDRDAQGRITGITNAAGDHTVISYDGAGRISGVAPPGGGAVVDRVAGASTATVALPNGGVHSYAWSLLGLPTRYAAPLAPSAFISVFDHDRRPVSVSSPSGRSASFARDAIGRLTTLSFGGDAIVVDYGDSTMRPRALHRKRGGVETEVLTYTYDGPRVASEAFSGAADGAFAWTFDDAGYLANIGITSGADVDSADATVDADGALLALGPVSIARDALTGLANTMDNSVASAAIGYDTHARVATLSVDAGGAAGPVYSLSLTHDADGRVASIVEDIAGTARTRTFTYDARGRQSTLHESGVLVATESYDADDNRTTGASTFDVADRVVTGRGHTYAFDDDGMLTDRDGDTFAYDARGDLTRAVIGGNTVDYDYDGLGRRVARIDVTGTFEYLYGDPQSLLRVTHVRYPDGDLALLVYDALGHLFGVRKGGVMFTVACDQVGTPRVVADDTGTVVKIIDRDPWGALVSDSNPAFVLPIGFAGGVDDALTGLVRFWRRDYDTETGRFTARDPMLFGGGQMNLYAYARNDPATITDMTGLTDGLCFQTSAYLGIGGGISQCFGTDLSVSTCLQGGAGLGENAGLSASQMPPVGLSVDETAESGVTIGPVNVNGPGYTSTPCFYERPDHSLDVGQRFQWNAPGFGGAGAWTRLAAVGESAGVDVHIDGCINSGPLLGALPALQNGLAAYGFNPL